MALAMIGPTPGTVVARRHNSESLAISWISVETESISLSSPCQRSPQPLQELTHPDGQAVLCIFQNTRQATCEQRTADRDHDAVLEKQGSQLVHDSGAFNDEALPDTVHSLHLQLVGRLERYRSHGAAAGGLGDRLCIVEVVLVRLQVGLHKLSWDHTHRVSGVLEASPPVLRAGTRLHGDDARRCGGCKLRKLGAIELLAKQRMALLVHSNEVEPVLAEIDPDDANSFFGHDGLPLKKLQYADARLEGQTIPLGYRALDVGRHRTYEVIDQICRSESVELACAVFDVTRSCLYAYRERAQRVDSERMALRSRVHELFVESRSSAGSRSIMGMMREQGAVIGRIKVSRLMGELGLICKQPGGHAYKQATVERVDIPNRLNRQFAVNAPNQVWCGDITYVWAQGRWYYLAAVLDLFS